MLKRFLDGARRVDRVVARVERAILSACILGIAAVGIANVLSRNLLGRSLSSAEEVAQLLVVLCTFLGIGHGVRVSRHIRMAALYDPLSGRPRKALLVVTWLGTAALCFALAVFAARYVESVWSVGSVTPALRLPLYWVYAWVPVGFVLGGLQYLLAALCNLVEPGVHLSLQLTEEQAAREADQVAGGGS